VSLPVSGSPTETATALSDDFEETGETFGNAPTVEVVETTVFAGSVEVVVFAGVVEVVVELGGSVVVESGASRVVVVTGTELVVDVVVGVVGGLTVVVVVVETGHGTFFG
jgi:hypothetical protein